MLGHPTLAVQTELAEVAAWADMMAAMPREVRQAMGAEGAFAHGAYVIAARNVPLVTFNRAIGAGLLGPVDLPALARHMRERAAPVAQLQLAPFCGLNPQADGFTPLPIVWAKLARRSGAETRPGEIVVAEAGPREAAVFAEVVARGFDMPPVLRPWLAALVGRGGWRCYLGRLSGQPVAGGALYLGGEGAWLGITATLPEARGRGAQAALLARRLRDAAEAGHVWAHTETALPDGPNPSFKNMLRAGFEVVHQRRNWRLA